MQSMLDDDGTSNTDFNKLFSAAPATGFLKSIIYSFIKFSGYRVRYAVTFEFKYPHNVTNNNN